MSIKQEEVELHPSDDFKKPAQKKKKKEEKYFYKYIVIFLYRSCEVL